jgi:phosphoserine phosphatase
MTVPLAISAKRSASADLPLAVGPAMSASGGFDEADVFIATLIAADRLGRGDISAASDALRAVGVEPEPAEWVEPGTAFDLAFERDAEAARSALDGLIESVDVIVQAGANRRRGLLAADMDSTMITVECIDELADFAGVKAEVAAVTEQAMRGELDFEAALDARVALLRGLDAALIDRCREERVRLMPGARTLVQTMRAHGAFTLLVSGGFTRFAEPVAAAIGFEAVASNRLVIEGDRLSGTVEKPIVGAEGKKQAMLWAAAERGIDRGALLAVGDGANDIPMLEAAGLGIAYRAKPAVAAAADARVDANDLTALLYAQGYSRSEWVE